MDAAFHLPSFLARESTGVHALAEMLYLEPSAFWANAIHEF